jgi:outer membrane biosynthesis protein TonB
MLKALLFGIALVGAAVIAIAGTAALAVLILFLTGKPTVEQNSVTPLLPPVVEDIPTPVDVTLVEETPPTTEPQQPVEKVVIEEKITKQTPKQDPKKLKKMTKKELQKLGETKGVTLKPSLLKDQMIERLIA